MSPVKVTYRQSVNKLFNFVCQELWLPTDGLKMVPPFGWTKWILACCCFCLTTVLQLFEAVEKLERVGRLVLVLSQLTFPAFFFKLALHLSLLSLYFSVPILEIS